MKKIRCKRCGKMFEFDGELPPACPMCIRERNEQFYIVRELVREFPGITALQVNQATEVPMDVILRFVEEGRIEVVPNKNKDGALDERIGLMIKKAKEMREFYRTHQEGKPTDKLDTLAEDDKFRWHEGSDSDGT